MDDTLSLPSSRQQDSTVDCRLKQLENRIDQAEHTLRLQDELFRLKSKNTAATGIEGTETFGNGLRT
jgi:hypothetical protein